MIMRILLLRRMHHPPLCRRPTTFLPSTKRVPVVSVIVPWIIVIVRHLIPRYDMKIIPHPRQHQHPRQRVMMMMMMIMIIITRMNNNPTRNRMIVVIIVVPAVVVLGVVNISIVSMIPIYPKGTSPILQRLLLRRIIHHHHHNNNNIMTI